MYSSLKKIEYAIMNSLILTRAKFAYFKDKTADEIIRNTKDIIADSIVCNNLD